MTEIPRKVFRRAKASARHGLELLEEMLPHYSLPRFAYARKFNRQKQNAKNVPTGFSIVMTTRNRRQFLSWAVEGILSNTQAPFEIIVMDNASSDGTAELCRELARQHPGKIRHVPLRRNFGTNAYALGFLQARFQFLVDMDDDILAVSQGWDAAVARAFSVVPRLGFLAMNVVQDKYTNGSKPDASHYSTSVFSDLRIESGPVGGWFAATTRDIYNEVGGFVFRPHKPFHLEDAKFISDMSKKGFVSAILKDQFVYHASGPYWNSAYGYNHIWQEKYRRDYKDLLSQVTAVKVDELPTVEYARSMVAQAGMK